MLIQLKVHGLNGTKIIAIDSKSVARTIVQQPETQVTYELIDTETGVAPQSIAVKRNGNHLDITFEDSETVNLTIEDYYTKEPLNPVIGLAENGEYYLYLPESELPADSIALLNDQVVATEVLAGDPVTVFWLQSPDLFSYVGWSLASAALLGIGTYYTAKFNRDPKESDVNTATPTIEPNTPPTTEPVLPEVPKGNENTVDTSKADLALAELKAAKAAFDKALSDLLTRAGQNGNVITADDIALLEALRQRLLDAKIKHRLNWMHWASLKVKINYRLKLTVLPSQIYRRLPILIITVEMMHKSLVTQCRRFQQRKKRKMLMTKR